MHTDKMEVHLSIHVQSRVQLTAMCAKAENGLSRYNYVASSALMGHITPVAGLVATCLFNR